MSALCNLKTIARNNKRRLLGTFALVAAENLLLLVYPVFGGFAINGVLAGNLPQALLYAFVVLVIWLVGAARRAADTRTFTRIYAEMVVPVIVSQRAEGEETSAVSARVALSRELVDFFENHLPTLITAAVSMAGAVLMLLIIEPWPGVAALAVMAVFALLVPRFAATNDRLYFRLSNRLEHDVGQIERARRRHLNRHYGLISRLRIRISNREAAGYLLIGLALCALFGFTFAWLTLAGRRDPGHIYAVVSYLWSFAMSIDDAPHLLEEFSKIKYIGKRVHVEDA